MADQEAPQQGGHNFEFGSAPPPPAPPTPDSAPGQPGASQYPGQQGGPTYQDQPGAQQYPGQPGAQPQQHPQPDAAPYPGQPGAPQFAAPGQPYQGQPAYPGQPYPGQPGAPQYAGQPAYSGQPGGGQPAYPGQPGGAPKKKSKGLLWGLIGGGIGLVAIIAILVLVVPALLRPGGVSAPATPADAVKSYLTAISKSDAKTALSYLAHVQNKDLLTDEVLKESNKLAPIKGITVKPGKDKYGSAKVDATFSIGGEKVSTTYSVYQTEKDWKISGGTEGLGLSSLKGLGATVNGVSAGKGDSYDVFPGTYQLGVESKYFSISGDSTFRIVTTDDTTAVYDLNVELNDDGVATYRTLVRSSLEACVALKTLSTPCGMDITSIDLHGATPVEGTVTRTLTAEGNAALNALQPKVSGSTPTVVSTFDSIRVDMSLQGSDGGTYTVLFGGYVDTPKVDFAAEQPTVVWE